MKLAYFQLDSYEFSPFTKNLQRLSRPMMKMGVDLDLVTVNDVGEEFTPPGVHRYSLSRASLKKIIPPHYRIITKLINYLRQQHPESIVVVGISLALPLFIARLLARVPLKIFINQQILLTGELEMNVHRMSKLFPIIARFLSKQPDVRFIAVSEGVGQDLIKVAGIPTNKVDVVYNPCPLPSKTQDNLLKNPLIEDIRQVGNQRIIVNISRLAPEKDHATLIHAFKTVLESENDCVLLIVGDGPLKSRLETLTNELGISENVWFTGRRDDVDSILENADLFVLSSRFEGFGNVVVEALAAGCPVVSTDCPSGPGEILGQGRYGILVSPGSVTELAAGIKEGLHKSWNIEKLRERAEIFSPENIAKSMILVTLGSDVI